MPEQEKAVITITQNPSGDLDFAIEFSPEMDGTKDVDDMPLVHVAAMSMVQQLADGLGAELTEVIASRGQ